MKKIYATLTAATVGLAAAIAQAPLGAGAQQLGSDSAQAAPQEPVCGNWQNGTWVPTGACAPDDYRSRVSGTITSVKGHLVTVQQSTQTLVINDQPALEHQTTGRIAVGRQVVAVGYWAGGTFYATRVS